MYVLYKGHLVLIFLLFMTIPKRVKGKIARACSLETLRENDFGDT